MTINRFEVKSPSQLMSTLKTVPKDGLTYILFNTQSSGVEEAKSELEKMLKFIKNGSYDVEAVIDDYLSFIPESRIINYIRCYLTPEMWGRGSELCADPKFRLLKVPTLLRWNGYERLELDEISRFPLLSLLFEENSSD